MGKIGFTTVDDIVKDNKEFYRFVAIFTWPPEADKIAREKFRKHATKYSPEFFAQTSREDLLKQGTLPQLAYSLTGARTVLVIAYTSSPQGLYEFCNDIIYDTPIEVDFYHAMDFDEAREFLKQHLKKH